MGGWEGREGGRVGGWVGGREGRGKEGEGVKRRGKREEQGTVVVASNDSPPRLPDAVTMRAKLRG